MGKTEITPYSVNMGQSTSGLTHIVPVKIKATGMYIKTSNIAASRMILIVQRTTKSTGSGRISILGGSTAGAEDYQGGAYSTKRNLDLTVATSSRSTAGSLNILGPFETARFKDSRGYINLGFSTKLSTALGANCASYIAAVVLKT